MDMLLQNMDKNEWNVGAAKQQFSEVLRRSEKEPQLIYRRDKLIAAVIRVDDQSEVPGFERRTIGERFAGFREILRNEGYRIPASPRRNRRSSFVDVLDDVAG